jgi:hypothetical protein
MKIIYNLIIISSIYCIFSKSAFAYIEPGGLFSMIGVLIASGMAALMIIKHKIIEIYKKIFKKNAKKK